MYKIITKRELNKTVTLMEIEAPLCAKKAKAGQFVILRTNEDSERIPLTVADFNREKGTVTVIFQIVGAETERLNHKNEGEYISFLELRRNSRDIVDGERRKIVAIFLIE